MFIYCMNYTPEIIGVGRYTGELGAYLVATGHEVEVVTAQPHYPEWAIKSPFANRYSQEHATGLRITRCPLWLGRRMRGLWRILAPLTFALTSAPVAVWRILASRPNTVLCVEPTLFSAPFALVAAKLVGARTVLHVQDLEIDAAFAMGHLSGGVLKSLAGLFEAVTIKRFDRLVTLSEPMRRRIVAKGVPEDRTVVVRNWVDLGTIKPVVGPNRVLSEMNLPPTAFVVLYAGSVGAKQALHIVLDAAERLVDHPNLVFVIAGEGPERARLVARRLPNVRFLPPQAEALLPELLAAADVHILPQEAGAADLVLPSKLGGMLASGKPLLVQANPDTELHRFLDGAATIVPAGDSDALATALRSWPPDTKAIAAQRTKLASELSSVKVLPAFRDVLSP